MHLPQVSVQFNHNLQILTDVFYLINNKRAKKPVNRFLQEGTIFGVLSLQTSIVIKLCQTP